MILKSHSNQERLTSEILTQKERGFPIIAQIERHFLIYCSNRARKSNLALQRARKFGANSRPSEGENPRSRISSVRGRMHSSAFSALPESFNTAQFYKRGAELQFPARKRVSEITYAISLT